MHVFVHYVKFTDAVMTDTAKYLVRKVLINILWLSAPWTLEQMIHCIWESIFILFG